MLYFPICTVSLVEEIYKYLSKVFDGRNPVFKTDFKSENHKQDWTEYFNSKLGGLDFWKIKGLDKMKTAINDIMIVDMPKTQKSERPDAYFYFIPFSSVIAYDLKNSECFNWIIFRLNEDKIGVYDDLSYRVFELKDRSTTEIKGEAIIDNPHDLTYCPARFFWTTPVNSRNPEIKKACISNQLGQLDKVLYYEISNEHLNSYARFPIITSFDTNCKYESELGEICDGGYLRDNNDYYIVYADGELKPCPVCEKKNLVGAGSKITVSPPKQSNNYTDLSNPVNIIGADVSTLDYNNKDIDRRKSEIFKNVTGFYGHSINDKAVNEKQVLAIFETLETALREPQKNFEDAIKWVTETICLLRYGRESFISCSVSLGTEHYILTSDQLLTLYQKSVDTKRFTTSSLDMIEDRYFETAYRNNPEQLRRQKILTNLDPFRHRSLDEVSKMFTDGQIKFEDYFIKANLSSLILRFERENIALTEYGSNSDFNIKIESIYQELVKYANEAKPIELEPVI